MSEFQRNFWKRRGPHRVPAPSNPSPLRKLLEEVRAMRTTSHIDEFMRTRENTKGLKELLERCETEMKDRSNNGRVFDHAICVQLARKGDYDNNESWQPYFDDKPAMVSSVNVNVEEYLRPIKVKSTFLHTLLYSANVGSQQLVVQFTENHTTRAEPEEQECITNYLIKNRLPMVMLRQLAQITPVTPRLASRIILMYYEVSKNSDQGPEAEQYIKDYFESYFGCALSAEVVSEFPSAAEIHSSLAKLRFKRLESIGVKEEQMDPWRAREVTNTEILIVLALLHFNEPEREHWMLAAQKMAVTYPSESLTQVEFENILRLLPALKRWSEVPVLIES